jgi:hypothetical protein
MPDHREPLPEHARKVLDAAQKRIEELEAELDATRRELCEKNAWYEPNKFYESYYGGVQGWHHGPEEYAHKRGWDHLYPKEKK